MAQEKILDMTKSAAANETAVNNKFEELSNQSAPSTAGGISNITVGDSVDALAGKDADIIEIDLAGQNYSWATDKKLNTSMSAVNAEGYTYNNAKGGVHLLAGDVIITNADSDGPLLLSSSDKWACGNDRVKVIDGRDAYDGKYVAYKATAECFITFSYKQDVNYDVHVFVVRCDVVEVPLMFSAGQLHGSYGYANMESYHNPFWSPGRHEVITDHIVLTGMQGRYLFIPEGLTTWGTLYTRYNALPADVTVSESRSDVKSSVGRTYWGSEKDYLIIPIRDEEEIYRVMMQLAYVGTAKAYLVTRNWLIKHGYADQWAGKKWIMYGDSYVQGQDIAPTWHDLFAMWHHTSLIRDGYKGMGLMLNANGNMVGTLVTHLESDLKPNGELVDVDIIGVCLGRNDYSKGVPIGNIDDIVTAYSTTNPTSLSHYTCYDREAKSTDTEQDHPNVIQATFCGGLNYLCKWLLTEYPDKRIFFLTPWYFLDDNPAGQATTAPVEYVDAVKAVAGKWGIPCFDAARQSGISVQSQAFRDLYFRKESGQEHSNDTSHLSIAGHRRMATGPVAAWLENLFRE